MHMSQVSGNWFSDLYKKLVAIWGELERQLAIVDSLTDAVYSTDHGGRL